MIGFCSVSPTLDPTTQPDCCVEMVALTETCSQEKNIPGVEEMCMFVAKKMVDQSSWEFKGTVNATPRQLRPR